jgi:hypothetical protein
MLLALAFVPLIHLEASFNSLIADYQNNCPELYPLLHWFEKNYYGRVLLGVRQTPPFPPCIWSCHERVRGDRHRTNNYAGNEKIM